MIGRLETMVDGALGIVLLARGTAGTAPAVRIDLTDRVALVVVAPIAGFARHRRVALGGLHAPRQACEGDDRREQDV